MNMFARFDENPAMTLQVIKETKRYGRTDARTHGQRENSIPTLKQSLRGYKKSILDWYLFITQIETEWTKWYAMTSHVIAYRSQNCFSVRTHFILIAFLRILIAYLRKYTAYLGCWIM